MELKTWLDIAAAQIPSSLFLLFVPNGDMQNSHSGEHSEGEEVSTPGGSGGRAPRCWGPTRPGRSPVKSSRIGVENEFRSHSYFTNLGRIRMIRKFANTVCFSIPWARFRLFYERYSARHMICKQNRNLYDKNQNLANGIGAPSVHRYSMLLGVVNNYLLLV